MKRLSLFVLLLTFVVTSGCVGFCRSGDGVSGKRIGLIEVKGVIVEPDDVVEDLEKARKSKKVKAVVVRVDSPGGSIGASQEILRTIQQVNEEKPVVVSMGDVAASGGYYVSVGAKKIFANEGTVTGSIGVRMEHLNARGLFEFLRLQPETIKSGKYKDIGSIYRAITPEEREILEAFLDELHDQFKADITKARGLERSFVDEIATGQVYTGLKAKDMGLIDEIGGLTDAVKAAWEMAGLKGEPKMVKVRKKDPWWYDIFSDHSRSLVKEMVTKISGHKYFLYEWSLF